MIYLKNKYSSDKIWDINNEHIHFYIHIQVQNHKHLLVLDYNLLEKKKKHEIIFQNKIFLPLSQLFPLNAGKQIHTQSAFKRPPY